MNQEEFNKKIVEMLNKLLDFETSVLKSTERKQLKEQLTTLTNEVKNI